MLGYFYFTANLYRSLKLEKVRLAQKYILGRHAQLPNLRLNQMHLLRHPPVLRVEKPINNIIEQRLVHRRPKTLASLSTLSIYLHLFNRE